MDKIEVGEYVRDTEGKIYKIETETLKDFFCIEISSKVNSLKLLSDLDIQKTPSKNIIDLIEVGDYVNGLIIIGKYFDENNKICLILDTTDKVRIRCYEQDIKSILTKEQFNSVKYEVD